MSAGYIDWHEDEKKGIKVCAILDDASRKILASEIRGQIQVAPSSKVTPSATPSEVTPSATPSNATY